MLSVAFQVVLDCPHCTAHIPLNAVVPGVHCPECRRALPIAAETWTKVLGQALDAAARASEGMPDVITEAFAGGDINAVFERKPPVCALCDAPIDAEAALAESRTTQGWAHCARCQGWLAFRPPPIAIRPHLVAIACEQFAASAEPDPSKATKPLSFSCHQCGAVLPVDGTSRMVACQYCRASVVLPDALWKTVRPQGKASSWYLLCRG